jgi:hypothetical protein
MRSEGSTQQSAISFFSEIPNPRRFFAGVRDPYLLTNIFLLAKLVTPSLNLAPSKLLSLRPVAVVGIPHPGSNRRGFGISEKSQMLTAF